LNIIDRINDPGDVKALPGDELDALCAQLRNYLIKNIGLTGGHLASNLGVVELTVALHRVFDTSVDRLVFDVGHQSYVHKLLTGRKEDFAHLRSYGGISGFPKPSESIHDAFTAGHASSAISIALGMARARDILKEDYNVIAMVGDGALTGGLAYEGLNDAGQSETPLIVILNDNGMSITKNVGGLSRYLARIRVKPSYFKFKKAARAVSSKVPGGEHIYNFFSGIKNRVKSSFLACRLFEDMGFYYIGPVDGSDIPQLEYVLRVARDMKRPVLVHVLTRKGKGHKPSELEPEKYHGISGLDSLTGKALGGSSQNFSSVFGKTLLEFAEKDERICAISASMIPGVGLEDFALRYPERCFDVGIAEEHAVSMAGGMAKQGLIPVFAVYSTFLQRSYDEIMQDAALQGLHVVFCVDRAGLVGEDGETHHGMFDIGMLTQIPGMTVYEPANYAELKSMLHKAVYECSGPVAVRYPRGLEGDYKLDTSPAEFETFGSGEEVTLVTFGRMFNACMSAREMLGSERVKVIKLNRVWPVDYDELFKLAGRNILVVQECSHEGSIGQAIAAAAAQRDSAIKVLTADLGNGFITHGSVNELLKRSGLDAEGICTTVLEGFDFERK